MAQKYLDEVNITMNFMAQMISLKQRWFSRQCVILFRSNSKLDSARVLCVGAGVDGEGLTIFLSHEACICKMLLGNHSSSTMY